MHRDKKHKPWMNSGSERLISSVQFPFLHRCMLTTMASTQDPPISVSLQADGIKCPHELLVASVWSGL